ncbi:MAG TPA: glycosyltransferase family 2 protein [Candidatus Woesebacteria bacterium]|nr:glycosyltransferase family 2 protein [Candidatus Woesebacteria bacterium]
MNISVVIPVYKKVDQFITNLKQNVKFLNNCEIIIVNDDPSESIASFLADFQHVTLIENKTNLGFAPTVNIGFSHAKNDSVLLLNSDVVLQDDSYKKALLHFTDTSIFAISFAQKEKNGEIVGKNKIYWEKGFFQHSKADNFYFGINGWAEGGSCLIDRKKFNILKGFDEIYSPFYWEDIDLSYRAWKKGYVVLFDPSIVVEHHHESTIGSFFKKKMINQIAFRNQLFFIWKNITDVDLLIAHLFYLILFILASIIKGDFVFLKAYFQALGRLPAILQKRRHNNFNHNDNEIISKFL